MGDKSRKNQGQVHFHLGKSFESDAMINKIENTVKYVLRDSEDVRNCLSDLHLILFHALMDASVSLTWKGIEESKAGGIEAIYFLLCFFYYIVPTFFVSFLSCSRFPFRLE